jgi:predicted ATPase
MTASFEDALAGRRKALLVAGEPRVGKTRLIGEAAQVARARGMLVLAGRCDPDLAAAYGPFTEAFRQAVGSICSGGVGWVLGPMAGRTCVSSRNWVTSFRALSWLVSDPT